ncbi:MAG: hypothetical protein AAF587_17515 [Bacteroidota bacterium]
MKHVCITSLWLLSVVCLYGQETSNHAPLSVAYFSQFGFQPGLAIGTAIPLIESADNVFLLRPQLGFFARPGNDRNWMLQLALGRSRQGNKPGAYSAFSLGVGVLAQSRLLSETTALGNGERISQKRERNTYLVPTLGYEYGRSIGPKLGWYLKPSIGARLTSTDSPTPTLMVEIGLNWYAR